MPSVVARSLPRQPILSTATPTRAKGCLVSAVASRRSHARGTACGSCSLPRSRDDLAVEFPPAGHRPRLLDADVPVMDSLGLGDCWHGLGSGLDSVTGPAKPRA